jgi:GTPase
MNDLKISPEKENGNIEYKLKLINTDTDKIQRLASQMRYRMDEGGGEAIYVIGVTDEGGIIGVTNEEFNESFDNLSLAANESNFNVTILTNKLIQKEPPKKIYELLVREKNEHKYIDIKVAVAGNVDSGKSSLLGVLISGKNDDGRGSARLCVFNFKHEISSGRTSSIAHHILGFDINGQPVNYGGIHKKDWPEIVRESSKVISFFDLCGHEKYLKTTILGLTSSSPDVCFILIGANMGITRMTQEHIFLCITLNIPFVIIVTKIDICENRQNILKETVNSINKLLKMPGLRRVPYKINNNDDVILCSKNIKTESIVPIFHISSVTGEGIDYLKMFLNLLGKIPKNIKTTNEVEFHIDTIFTVPGVGTVVGGQHVSGNIKIGDKLLLGPNNGEYIQTQVRSIHCKRVPLEKVEYGSYVCLGLKKVARTSVRKGNVLLSLHSKPICIKDFEAEITVLKAHSTTIKPGYQPIIHANTMRQTATLISIINKTNALNTDKEQIADNILRTGDKAVVKFRFCYRDEFIKSGTKLLMAEGKVKVVGVVR